MSACLIRGHGPDQSLEGSISTFAASWRTVSSTAAGIYISQLVLLLLLCDFRGYLKIAVSLLA